MSDHNLLDNQNKLYIQQDNHETDPILFKLHFLYLPLKTKKGVAYKHATP